MKPIVLLTPEVEAIIDGRKTQTRLAVKPQLVIIDQCYGMNIIPLIPNAKNFIECCCPYQPGDILYVKETWAWLSSWDCDNNMCNCETVYKDEMGCFNYRTNYGTTKDDSFPPDIFKWKSSRFMPKVAARLFLEVKNVRVERLQDVGWNDVVKEGIEPACDEYETQNGRLLGVGLCINEDETIKKFRELWDSLNTKRGYPWTSNPWVWVIEFKQISKKEAMGRVGAGNADHWGIYQSDATGYPDGN